MSMRKDFNKSSAMKAIVPTLSGLGTAFGMDYMNNPDVKTPVVDTIKQVFAGDSAGNRLRTGNLFLNAGVGALASGAIQKGEALKGIGIATAIPAKDILINSMHTPAMINETLSKVPDMQNAITSAAEQATTSGRVGNVLMGALGAGALGLGAIGIGKYLTNRNDEKSKIKLRVPGDPADPSTDAEVEIPMDVQDLHPNIVNSINRTVNKKTRQNAIANSRKRDPISGQLIPYGEWEAKYGNSVVKTASRAWAEGAGSIISAAGSGGAGYAAGGVLADAAGINPVVGRLSGGLLGAILPSLAGSLAGKLAPDRTQAQQDKHDSQSAFAEYIMPGYATYQASRRANTIKNKDLNDEYDDLDKIASHIAPPPPTQAQPTQQQMTPVVTPAVPDPGIKSPALGNRRGSSSNMQQISSRLQALKLQLRGH